MFKSWHLAIICLTFLSNLSRAQCPEEIYSEDFNTGGYPGLIDAVLYTGPDGGTWDNPAYMIDGTDFGWWNVINGVGDVDVFSLDVVACPFAEIEISIFLRESYGGTDIDLLAYDGTGALMDFENIILSGAYTEYTLDFTLGADPNINFVVHCNSTGGGGIDICAENLTINSNDVTPPTVADPLPDLFGACLDEFPPDPTVVTGVTDNCALAATVVHLSDDAVGDCPVVVTRTYEVSDDCGNATLVTQLITIEDLIAPTASNPAPIAVECIGDVPVPDIAVVTDADDNCGVPTVIFVSDVSDGGSCPEIITRTYRVEDLCANFVDVTQEITIFDTTPPTASNPAPIDVPCLEDIPAPDVSVVTDEADNCSTPIVAFVSDLSDGETCNLETITRTYSVTDECGNSITVIQVITVMAVFPDISAGDDINGCEGDEVVVAAINPDGAVIDWTAPIVDGAPFSPPTGTTIYTVTATVCADACPVTDDISVTINENPLPSFIGDQLIGCPDHFVNFTNTTPGTSVDCVWTFGDGSISTDCSPVSHTYSTTGLYDVTLTMTDDNGCEGSVTYTDYVEVIDPPTAYFTSSPGAGATDIDFFNESTGAIEFDWDFGDGGTSLEINPGHTYPGGLEGTYVVSLTATNAIGCTDEYTQPVYISSPLIYYVPNVFTPDGNDFNEIFQPVFTAGYDPYDFHMIIFNRWGEIVFESYDSSKGWNGNYGNQGMVADGVYVWQIEFGLTTTDERIYERGTVTILK